MPYYAVRKGHKIGIYRNWNDVKPLVTGYKGAIHKKFATEAEARRFMDQNTPTSSTRSSYDNQRSISSRTHASKVVSRPSSSETQWSSTMLGESTPNHAVNHLSGTKVPTTSNTNLSSNAQSPREIYTDGASRNNGSIHAIAGYGVYSEDPSFPNASVSWDECKHLTDSNPTNQTMELLAVRHGLKLVADDKCDAKVVLKTDSKFAIDCLTKWSANWERNGWKTSTGKDVIHKTIIKDCNRYLDKINRDGRIKLSFVHVRGHQGIYGNEMADRLANQACDKMSK